jgi:transposase
VEIKRKLRRSELIAFFEKQEACIDVAPRTSNLRISRLPVLVIRPRRVFPPVEYCRGTKPSQAAKDPADAAVLCAAASRPDMIFVPVKNIEQQGILALHSARSLLVKQQTMLANAMRGLATEFGLTVPQGIGRLEELMALLDADKAVPVNARQVFTGLFDQCRALAESIRSFEVEIVAHARQDETARRLATDPAGMLVDISAGAPRLSPIVRRIR